ncbi:hypothetical protein D3H55_20740 [Bacillus salacetis]|uniref:Uncharacterized protein n=1 Tax=Bacillus salacetis TaxID=2315464 RepID=A0A3A1QSV2_9BACI|nr:hypothetical protein [Bacillus salacetis]RIW28835.1 hypothetical protein D3H55_20740 [Bacillus salacetis]
MKKRNPASKPWDAGFLFIQRGFIWQKLFSHILLLSDSKGLFSKKNEQLFSFLLTGVFTTIYQDDFLKLILNSNKVTKRAL